MIKISNSSSPDFVQYQNASKPVFGWALPQSPLEELRTIAQRSPSRLVTLGRQMGTRDLNINMTKISNSSSPESFFSSSKYTKTRFRTPLGELTTLHQLLSRMGRGYPLTIPLPLEGYGVSDLSQLINY